MPHYSDPVLEEAHEFFRNLPVRTRLKVLITLLNDFIQELDLED
jgi:hypothetical protein